LLVRAGLIDESSLGRARAASAEHGGSVPEHLVLAGVIDDDDLTRFLADHLRLPRIDPEVLDALPADARARLAADAAVELRAVPIALDRAGGLLVALSDPCDPDVLALLGEASRTYVVRAICTQRQLAWCLARYYGHTTELGRSLPAGGGPPVSVLKPVSPSELFGSDFRDEETGVTGPIRRRLPPASPAELAPRSGEFVAAPPPAAEPDPLPPVVVAEAEPSPDVLSMQADMARRSKQEKAEPKPGSGPSKPASSAAVDDGWDVDAWAPGNTLRPTLLDTRIGEAAGVPVVEARADVVVSQTQAAPVVVAAPPPPAAAPVATQPRVPEPDAAAVAASADRLLGVLRELDDAASRDAVLDVALAFIGTASPRNGFAARKGEALASLRGKGAALGGEVAFTAGPMMDALLRGASYRDAVAGAEANFVSTLFDHEPIAVSAVPLVVRNKLVGAFFAEATASLVDEHIAVVSRAAGLALERILKEQKK
jgi:hypothetical protein